MRVGPGNRQLVPVASTGSVKVSVSKDLATTKTLDEQQLSIAALDETIKAMGGKAGMIATLSVASDVPEVEGLLRLVLDPRYDGMPLRKLCTLAGITVVDLLRAFKQASIVKAHLEAYRLITSKLLPIIDDVMTRAAPYTIPCYTCGGKKQVVERTPAGTDALLDCETCHGQGELLQLPDLDRQKVALELAQLVQKAAGITLQQNNLTVPPRSSDPDPDGAPPSGTLIGLQHALADLQRGPRQPILDAEVVPVSPNSDEVVP